MLTRHIKFEESKIGVLNIANWKPANLFGLYKFETWTTTSLLVIDSCLSFIVSFSTKIQTKNFELNEILCKSSIYSGDCSGKIFIISLES